MTRPSIEQLCELLSYDAETGVLTWRKTVNSRAVAGARAGCLKPAGYRYISIDGREYPAQNIAFAIHHARWPEKILDHGNRDRDDNSIENLIEAGYSQNNRNNQKKNATGFRGVLWNCNKKRFKAKIKVSSEKDKYLYLGTFDTAEEAARAYDAAVLEHCGPRFPTNASLGLLP